MPDVTETNNNWLVFVKKPDTAKQLMELNQQGVFQADIHTGGIEDALTFISQKHSKEKFLLLEITDTPNVIQLIDELAEYCDEDTHLICLGYDNDVNLYRNLIRSGVDDYHTLPIDILSLTDCISNIHENKEPTKEETKLNSMISIIGSRGGIGTSTIASSIAWILAKDFLATTCLLDLDIYNGTSSLIFNKDPNQGLTQALANADRLDAVFLKRLTLDINKQLSILSSEQGIERDYFITDEDLVKLTKLVKNNFDYTVVDINYNNLYSGILLSSSSDIVLTAEFSISSIRDTAKILKICKTRSPFAKIKIIGVKNNLAKSVELTQTQFEDGIQQPVDYIIPFDRKATLDALNIGTVFADKFPSHPINRKLRSLTSSITKASIFEEKLTWLDKIKTWKL